MRNIKTLFIISFFTILCIKSNAQQAVFADYVANWTGTGSDGNSYTMTLNEDITASLKANNINTDVVAWKLNYDPSGKGIIAYDSNNHTTMRLVTNVNITSSGSNQTSLPASGAVNGSSIKIYYSDVFYDTTTNIMTMVLDFRDPTAIASGINPVTITFTK